MSKNKELLDKLMSGEAAAIDDQNEVIKGEIVNIEEPKTTEDGIEIPKYVPAKQKGRAPEDSIANLRNQRDEARKKVEEQEKLLAEKEEALKNADSTGTIFAEVKKLINKEDVTPEDLKKIFDDYDFTKKEKEALATQLKETQERLRDHDIRQSNDFIESYEKPILQAQQALAVEIVPIVNGKPVNNQKAADHLKELIESGDINPASVKVTLMKIRDAYEDAGIDYEMPSVRNVLSCLTSVIDLHERAGEAYKSWEQVKIQKSLEKQEINESKQTLVQARSREERKVIAKGYLATLVKSQHYDHIADMYGHERAMQVAIDSHNKLSDMMDDPSKAPTYDIMLDMMTKAQLFDKMIEKQNESSKLSDIEVRRAAVENVGKKKDVTAKPISDNRDLLRSMGVPVS